MSRRTLFMTLGLGVVTGTAVVAAGLLLGRPTGSPEVFAAAPAEIPGLLPAPVLDANGFWVAEWYRPTSGDLARDAALAAQEGKLLAVFWERYGCEFCALMHNRALRVPEVHDYVANKFYVVRLDFYGDKKIRDFDGETASERDIAERHRATGTPTLEFHTADGKEVLRIPGFVEAPILLSAFEFVDTGAYRGTNINAWLKAHGFLL